MSNRDGYLHLQRCFGDERRGWLQYNIYIRVSIKDIPQNIRICQRRINVHFMTLKAGSVTIWLLLKWLFFIQCKGLIMKFLMIIVSKTIKWPSFEWKWNFFFFYPSINYVWVQNISFCLHCDVFIASVWGKWPFDLLGFNFRLIIMMNLISCKHLVHTSHDIKWLWKLYSYSYWLIE